MKAPAPLMRSRRLSAAATLAALLACPPLAAQDVPTPPPPRQPLPLWEVGAFALGVTQQAYPGSDEQVGRGLALPFVIYRGPLLRADRGTLGLRALKTPTFEVDIGFAGAFGSSSDRVEARRGMPNLGTLVEFGPRAKWLLGRAAGGSWRAELPVRGVFDLSDSLASRGVAAEPELSYERRSASGWNYAAGIGAVFGNRKLTDTFYGVAPVYATAGRPAYEASAGLISTRLTFSASRPITPDWRFFGFARVDTVAGARNEDSPLVRQKTGGSVGVGISYTWLRSERLAAD